MLEQTSENSRPDRPISGCSGAFFGPVLAGEQTKPVLAREQIKKSASSTGTRSRRTAASHQSRDSTSELGCCQQIETSARHSRFLRPGRFYGTERSRPTLPSRFAPANRSACAARNLSSSFVTRHFPSLLSRFTRKCTCQRKRGYVTCSAVRSLRIVSKVFLNYTNGLGCPDKFYGIHDRGTFLEEALNAPRSGLIVSLLHRHAIKSN